MEPSAKNDEALALSDFEKAVFFALLKYSDPFTVAVALKCPQDQIQAIADKTGISDLESCKTEPAKRLATIIDMLAAGQMGMGQIAMSVGGVEKTTVSLVAQLCADEIAAREERFQKWNRVIRQNAAHPAHNPS